MTAVVDTIAALATPPGVGGVAIVRLSGANAKAIAERLSQMPPRPPESQSPPAQVQTLAKPERSQLLAPENSRQIAKLRPRYAHYRIFVDAVGVIDDGLAIYMPGPHSYTGEDVVELQIHGSPLLARRLLRACYALGARPAEPGEYTERAYRNGRLDLAQAEAVADLIHAQTERSAALARASLDGALADRLGVLREPLTELRAWVEADLDFGETDLDEMDSAPDDEPVNHASMMVSAPSRSSAGRPSTTSTIATAHSSTVEATIRERLHRLRELTNRLVNGLARQRHYRDGVKIAIVGAPNVGKSSLLNAWLGENRAIVSAHEGTTRDVIEAQFVAGDWLLRVLDTAGLRATDDPVEKIGIERSVATMREADVVLWVADSTRPVESAPPWWTHVSASTTPDSHSAIGSSDVPVDKPWLIIWNKIDLAQPPTEDIDPQKRTLNVRPAVSSDTMGPLAVSAPTWAASSPIEAPDDALDAERRDTGVTDSRVRPASSLTPYRWVVCQTSAATPGNAEILAGALDRLFSQDSSDRTAEDFEYASTTASASRSRELEIPNDAADLAFSVRERHLEGLRQFEAFLAEAERESFADLRAEHLRLAERALDRLLGASDVEDLLGSIFSGFCIGK
ncbi:MAG: tRNA modification GTPase [Thioalkalivibrionaceae bacterium]